MLCFTFKCDAHRWNPVCFSGVVAAKESDGEAKEIDGEAPTKKPKVGKPNFRQSYLSHISWSLDLLLIVYLYRKTALSSQYLWSFWLSLTNTN